jgi:hypothetical protein
MAKKQAQPRIVKSSVHIGDKKAFNGWKLIWLMSDHTAMLAPISERTAKQLLAAGMDMEG